jgi:hypothetical protein
VSRTAVGATSRRGRRRALIGVTPAPAITLSVLSMSKARGRPKLSGPARQLPPRDRRRPLPTSAVEESLSRLIANARNELDEANFIRKTPMPKVTQLRSQRIKTDKVEKADKVERSESAEKAEPAPATRKTRGALREVSPLEPTSSRGLEGQVRGLTAKRG